MRKIISSLTLLSLLNFMGCGLYLGTETVKPEEYIEYEKEEGKPKKVFVLTNDSLTYHFADWGYNILNDTLYGNGAQVVDETEKPFKGKIPLENINTIEWSVISPVEIAFGVVSAAIILYLIIGYAIEQGN